MVRCKFPRVTFYAVLCRLASLIVCPSGQKVRPDGAPQGSCWGRTVSPAVIETVTEPVQVSPAQYNPDGSLLRPPTYRSEARQMIVTPRVDSWFETPCAEALTPDFIASLQRALAVRRYYEGPITGILDKSTQAAIRAFQRTTGVLAATGTAFHGYEAARTLSA